MNALQDKLRAFAKTALPPDVVMALECAEDETGDGLLAKYGERLRRCALEKTPVLPGEDREVWLETGERITLLLIPASLAPIRGTRKEAAAILEREAEFSRWGFAGVGFGETPGLAAENALRALAVPADHMECGGMKDLSKRLYGAGKLLRVSVRDGGGNFCAVYVHPWALRRVTAEHFQAFVKSSQNTPFHFETCMV